MFPESVEISTSLSPLLSIKFMRIMIVRLVKHSGFDRISFGKRDLILRQICRRLIFPDPILQIIMFRVYRFKEAAIPPFTDTDSGLWPIGSDPICTSKSPHKTDKYNI